MTMWKKLLLAAAISWVFSVALGLLLAARVFVPETRSLSALLLPGVIPVAVIGSTMVALLVVPFALWAMRTGTRNLFKYAPILWIILAAYIVLVMPIAGHNGQYGLLFLAVIGLVILGFIPAAK
jgi:hypothetical protein